VKWTDQVFAYCERGSDPRFWAEPLNAISNIAFIAAAVWAFSSWRRKRPAGGGVPELILILIVVAIGIGSFLFHTLATRWAQIADTAPIGIFMITYLGFAIRRYLAAGWPVVAAGIVAFVLAATLAGSLRCGDERCFNGSLGYAPALLALWAVGGMVAAKGHPAARSLLAAGGIFTLSLVFRSLDMSACARTLVHPDWRADTHALWHMLSAIVLYILLMAALQYGQAQTQNAKVIKP
jgi:Ceramidase